MEIVSTLLGSKRKKVENFALQQLDCVVHAVHQCVVLLKDEVVILNMFDNV